MFALLAAGRLVQTNFVQSNDPTKFLALLEAANTVNHIAFFLTGTAALPAGFGASLYLGYPVQAGNPTAQLALDPITGTAAQLEWRWMGYLTNEKPSAIFRLGGQRITTDEAVVTAQVGVSIEPLERIAQLAAAGAAANPHIKFSLEEMGQFCRKMLGSFYNYASSFVVQVPPPPLAFGVQPPSQPMFPADVLQKWYQSVERKATLDPNWWRELQG